MMRKHNIGDKLYRYEYNFDSISLNVFEVTKLTTQGFWIERADPFNLDKPKWLSLTTKYAHHDLEDAKKSLIVRSKYNAEYAVIRLKNAKRRIDKVLESFGDEGQKKWCNEVFEDIAPAFFNNNNLDLEKFKEFK